MKLSFSKHKVALALLDIFLILVGFMLSFWFVFVSGFYGVARDYPVYFIPSVALLIIIYLTVFQLEGLYKYQAIVNPVHQVQTLLKCFLMVLSGFILIVFFMKTEYIADSRLTIGLGFLTTFLMMVFIRSGVVPRIFLIFVKKGWIRKNVVIVGAGEHGCQVYEQIKANPYNYFNVVGFCDDDPAKIGSKICDLPVLGSSFDLAAIAVKQRLHEVVIAITNIKKSDIVDMIDRCKAGGLVIHVISDIFAIVMEKMEAEEFGGFMSYRITSRSYGIVRMALKRWMDLAGSTFLLALLSPVFAVIAWLIKRDTRGPVFYRSEVIGKDAKPFIAYKFRSMIYGDPEDPEEKQKYEDGRRLHLEFMKNFIQGNVKSEYYVNDESRITKVGRLLRKYSIDELPQLINVFRGEMSLVGPRFCSPVEYGFYKPWHKRRFRMKPGMTGLWQVRARSAVSYDDMVMLDLYYIENWSILFDIEILLRTIKVVLFGTGSRIQ
jgi:exopolysaccharide biosynthesis polyprenyl glycosylphosphotransferase